MHLSAQEIPGNPQFEFFPPEWLNDEPLRTTIHTAPTGIALLKAVRNETGQITDFQYRMANLMQRALTNYPWEDLLRQPLTSLNPDIVGTGMLDRLIQVVDTGQPCQYVEEYRLHGHVGCYDQVYVKSGDGVLMLVQDVTYSPLSSCERLQQAALLEAIQNRGAIADIRSMLVGLITGQAH